MGEISIGMNSQMDTTVVSNQFIDEYMPSANGEYVKIYLYILRSVNHQSSTFSIEETAQHFDHTVSYIMSVLKYWESVGLLQIRYGADKKPEHITFMDLCRHQKQTEDKAETGRIMPITGRDFPEDVSCADELIQKRPYTLAEKQQFAKDENFSTAKFVTQTWMGRPLGPSQLENLMFIYDGLGFDADLIDYLVEYCVGKGKKSMRYVEATAIAWAKQGITTVEQAKQYLSSYRDLASGIMQEFGITTRSLVSEERAYIEKWKKEYGMSDELILEACRRTIRAIKKPSFDYAGSILENWHKSGVSTISDVKESDQAHRQKSASSAKTSAASGAQKNRRAKTTPFPQREYDMNELERQLVQAR